MIYAKLRKMERPQFQKFEQPKRRRLFRRYRAEFRLFYLWMLRVIEIIVRHYFK